MAEAPHLALLDGGFVFVIFLIVGDGIGEYMASMHSVTPNSAASSDSLS